MTEKEARLCVFTNTPSYKRNTHTLYTLCLLLDYGSAASSKGINSNWAVCCCGHPVSRDHQSGDSFNNKSNQNTPLKNVPPTSTPNKFLVPFGKYCWTFPVTEPVLFLCQSLFTWDVEILVHPVKHTHTHTHTHTHVCLYISRGFFIICFTWGKNDMRRWDMRP